MGDVDEDLRWRVADAQHAVEQLVSLSTKGRLALQRAKPKDDSLEDTLGCCLVSHSGPRCEIEDIIRNSFPAV